MFITDIFKNYHIMCALSGWILAQFIKFIITLIGSRELDFRKFFENGGMPSSHTATVWAMTVSIGRVEGVDTPIFALAAIFTMVVMIDAMGVRRATGENSKMINKMIHDLFEEKTTEYFAKDLKEYVGHKPLEVLVGALIGVAIPLIIAPF